HVFALVKSRVLVSTFSLFGPAALTAVVFRSRRSWCGDRRRIVDVPRRPGFAHPACAAAAACVIPLDCGRALPYLARFRSRPVVHTARPFSIARRRPNREQLHSPWALI